MSSKKDIIVGLFVIVAILFLASATMMLRHLDLFNRRDTYNVLFNHVKQLDIGSPVLAFGINVGTVTGLEYIGEPRPIKVTIRIDKKVKLFTDALLRVNPAQVIGNTTLIIDSIGGGKGSHMLKPGDTIMANEPQGMESAMNDVFQGLSKIINNNDTQTAVKEIIMNMDSVTRRMDETFRMINEEFMPMLNDLKASSNNLNKLLTDAQEAVQRAADSVSSASQSFQTTAAEYGQTARSLNGQVGKIAEKLDATIGQLQKTVAGSQQPINDMLNELRESSRSLREVVDKINRGEGTLGKLISDPRPFQRLQELIDAFSQKFTGGGGGESLFPQVQTAPGGRQGGRKTQTQTGGSSFPKVAPPSGGRAEQRQP